MEWPDSCGTRITDRTTGPAVTWLQPTRRRTRQPRRGGTPCPPAGTASGSQRPARCAPSPISAGITRAPTLPLRRVPLHAPERPGDARRLLLPGRCADGSDGHPGSLRRGDLRGRHPQRPQTRGESRPSSCGIRGEGATLCTPSPGAPMIGRHSERATTSRSSGISTSIPRCPRRATGTGDGPSSGRAN